MSEHTFLCRGRNKSEFDRLMSEMERLRVVWVWQEFRRIQLTAAEAGLQAVISAVSCDKPAVKVPSCQQSREVLKQEILASLNRAADAQCQRILNIDRVNKEARNRVTIRKLEEIRDILLQQVSKREILAVLIDNEKRKMESVEEMMKDVITIFKDESTKLTNFRGAMKGLADKKSESEANLIPAEDIVMIRVHKILFNHQLVSHIPTYNSVFQALAQLEEEKHKMEKQLVTGTADRSENFKLSSQKLGQIFR